MMRGQRGRRCATTVDAAECCWLSAAGIHLRSDMHMHQARGVQLGRNQGLDIVPTCLREGVRE